MIDTVSAPLVTIVLVGISVAVSSTAGRLAALNGFTYAQCWWQYVYWHVQHAAISRSVCVRMDERQAVLIAGDAPANHIPLSLQQRLL